MSRIVVKACQALMDNLYAAGFRPTEAAGSAGQREALERHLEDMRTIAFDWIDYYRSRFVPDLEE